MKWKYKFKISFQKIKWKGKNDIENLIKIIADIEFLIKVIIDIEFLIKLFEDIENLLKIKNFYYGDIKI